MSYYSIERPTTGEYKEKGSKFLSFAYPVASKSAIQSNLESLRKTYHDARHHCYAYKLGGGLGEFRVNDDGEPRHSAGDPIMGQIRHFNLSDVLVVVVRYFGGTKLGVSGLIGAYKTAAFEALSCARQIEIRPTKTLFLNYSYSETAIVERLISNYQLAIVRQDFAESCKMEASLFPEQEESIQLEMNALKMDFRIED